VKDWVSHSYKTVIHRNSVFCSQITTAVLPLMTLIIPSDSSGQIIREVIVSVIVEKKNVSYEDVSNCEWKGETNGARQIQTALPR
jgi:hypothetical protein